MDFVTVVDQAIVLRRQQGRLTSRTLQFPLQPLWVHPSRRGHGYGSRRLADPGRGSVAAAVSLDSPRHGQCQPPPALTGWGRRSVIDAYPEKARKCV